MSRRSVIRSGLLGGAALATGLNACNSDRRSTRTTTSTTFVPTAGSRTLLVYFSRAGENYHYGGRRNLTVGNTEVLANLIAERIDCDTYRIEAADPYPDAYEPTVERNVEEQRANARPAIANPLPDVDSYDMVLLGSPVWNVRSPMIMSTFTDGVDLTGKTVLPFVTYAVSGIGNVEDDHRDALPGTDVRTGLAVLGETVTDAGPEVDEWLATSRLR